MLRSNYTAIRCRTIRQIGNRIIPSSSALSGTTTTNPTISIPSSSSSSSYVTGQQQQYNSTSIRLSSSNRQLISLTTQQQIQDQQQQQQQQQQRRIQTWPNHTNQQSSFLLPWNSQNAKTTTTTTRLASSTATQQSPKFPPNLFIDPAISFLSDTSSSSKRRSVKPKIPSVISTTKTSTTDDKEDNEETINDTVKDEDIDDEDWEDMDDDVDDDDEDDLFDYDPAAGERIYAKPLPERLKVEVHTLFAPQYATLTGTLWLDETVFGCDPIRVDLLKRAVDYYRNQKRGRRKAHTKTVSEVSGSGRKLRRQKGTGMARVGHSRPAHFRGGAKAHGPNKHNNTDYSNCKMNKKVMALAIRNALSTKLKENNLIVLNELYSLPTHKTKDFVQLLNPWNIATGKSSSDTALIIDYYYPKNDKDDTESDPTTDTTTANTTTTATSYRGVPINLYVASSNLYQIKIGNALHGINVYDILKYNKLIITLAALEHLESRLRE